MQALSQDKQIGNSDEVCRVVRSMVTACLVCRTAHLPCVTLGFIVLD